MIEEIIKLRGDGFSFRKIATELNTTVGKVQYRWNKWMENNETKAKDHIDHQTAPKDTISSDHAISPEFIPLKGELKAKLVTPRKIILFWEVSTLPQKIIEVFFNQKSEDLVTVIRMYDVTDRLFNGKNAHHYNEIAVPYKSGHWFIKGLVPNRSYLAEIGVYVSESEFFPLYRSNCIQTPSIGIQTGNLYHQDFLQIQQYEDKPPKWVEQVSTYSYYLKDNNLEEKNE